MEEFIDDSVRLNLIIDEDNAIQAYSRCGTFINATKWKGKLPDGFEDDFKPSFFLLQNGDIVENPNYVQPKLDFGPSSEQQILIQQAMTITQMQQMLMQQSKDIATLKGVNK